MEHRSRRSLSISGSESPFTLVAQDQRIRTSRIKAQVETGGPVLAPYNRIEQAFRICRGSGRADPTCARDRGPRGRVGVSPRVRESSRSDYAAAEQRDQPGDEHLLPITVNETRRLVNAIITLPAIALDHVLRWSRWRRRHEANAGTSHYRRRDHKPNDHRAATWSTRETRMAVLRPGSPAGGAPKHGRARTATRRMTEWR